MAAKWAEDFSLASNDCFPYESGLTDTAGPPCSKRCADPAKMYRCANQQRPFLGPPPLPLPL